MWLQRRGRHVMKEKDHAQPCTVLGKFCFTLIELVEDMAYKLNI